MRSFIILIFVFFSVLLFSNEEKTYLSLGIMHQEVLFNGLYAEVDFAGPFAFGVSGNIVVDNNPLYSVEGYFKIGKGSYDSSEMGVRASFIYVFEHINPIYGVAFYWGRNFHENTLNVNVFMGVNIVDLKLGDEVHVPLPWYGISIAKVF